VCRCWAAGAERAHEHEQAMLEYDVPSNGTRRRSCGGKLFREMEERDGRIEDAAQVFDEMPMHAVLKNARVLLLGEASRVQDAVGRMLRRCAEQRCAGAARQGQSKRVTGNRRRRSYAGQRRAVARRAGRRCAGKSHAVLEELQCDGCGRIRPEAIEPRVVNVGDRRGEGNG
jgi:hypothetical protein